MFKNIDEALNWIVGRKRNNHSFSDFKKLNEELNNPADKLRIIHVAGTNGKGSTVTMLRDFLMENGYKVGTLQSPHFLTHLDRIRINNQNIPEEIFLKKLNDYYDLSVKENLGMFEIDFLVAIDYFINENVDFAIIEVGIGGRLDSTNVINKPLLSIITNIGLDHQDMLGPTLDLICKEKCGIIKDSSKTLVGYLSDDLKDIVRSECLKHDNKYYEVKMVKCLNDRLFEYKGIIYNLASLALYQIFNAALALEAYDILVKEYGINYDIQKIKKALINFRWPGRFDIVNKKPLIILDGAHNKPGVEALMESFDLFKGSKCIIFSALKRKNYQEMYDILSNHCDEIIVTSFNIPGSIEQSDINNECYYQNYQEALEYAKKRYENILVCGSLYFISDVAKYLGGSDGKR